MGWRDGWCPVWTGGGHWDSGRWSCRWAGGDGGIRCGSPLLPSVLLVKLEPEEKSGDLREREAKGPRKLAGLQGMARAYCRSAAMGMHVPPDP